MTLQPKKPSASKALLDSSAAARRGQLLELVKNPEAAEAARLLGGSTLTQELLSFPEGLEALWRLGASPLVVRLFSTTTDLVLRHSPHHMNLFAVESSPICGRFVHGKICGCDTDLDMGVVSFHEIGSPMFLLERALDVATGVGVELRIDFERDGRWLFRGANIRPWAASRTDQSDDIDPSNAR